MWRGEQGRQIPFSGFAGLLAATVLSNTADGIVRIVIPLLAIELTRSPTLVALSSAFAQAPWLVFVLFAGAIVDRVDRRHLMLTATLLRMGVLAGFGWLVALGEASIPLLYIFAFAVGVLETLNDTSKQTIVPMVVGSKDLNRANGRLHVGELVANEFFGPLVGAALVGAGMVVALATGSVMYGLAVPALLVLKGSFQVSTTESRGSLWVESTAGIRLLWNHTALRKLALIDGLSQLFFGAWMSVFVLFAVDPGPMGLSEFGFGVLFALTAVGSVLGASAVVPVENRLGHRRTMAVAMVGWAVLLGAPAVTTNRWLVAALFAFGASAGTMFGIVALTTRQTLATNHTLGRINAGHRMFAWGSLPVGALIAGPVVELLGLRALFVFTAIGTLFLAVWAWFGLTTGAVKLGET